jgi:PLD-like domain
MKFLNRDDTEGEVGKLLSNAKRIRIAVAYWGQGVSERLGLLSSKTCDIEVVCDLLSGACNPDELTKLRDALGHDRVLKCRKLHAKVWLVDGRCILGSSNASTNGLAQEGKELDGLIEANVLIDDPACVRAISEWYETSVRKAATEISGKDLELARARWKARRRIRPPPDEPTLLAALQANKDAMSGKNVFVFARSETEDLGKTARAILQEEQKLREDRGIDAWEVDLSDVANLPAGACIIEFEVYPKKKPQLLAVYRLLREDHIVTRKDVTLLLCKEVKGNKVDGLPLGSLTVWKAAVDRAVKSAPDGSFFGEVAEFARGYLAGDVSVRTV